MPETPKSTKILISTILISIIFPIFILGQVDFSLPNPGLTPDSPFYFFDTLREKISLFFTFAPEKKAEKAIQFAEEKLAEAKAMAEKNKPEAIEKANQKYQEFLGLANQKTHEAKEKGRDVEELAILITEKTLKHQEILVEVLEKVPKQAKIAVEKAIEASRKGSEVAVQAVTGAKKDELLQKIEEIRVEKEEALLPTEEEIPPEGESPEEKPIEKIEPKVTCQDECSQIGLKRCSNNGYQTCGNYDSDECLEWSSITNCSANNICQNGSCVQQKCSDGTLYGQCSTSKPEYCENGNLINKCSICGCSSNQSCQSDGSCKNKQALEKVYSIIVGYMDDNSPAMHALWYYDLLTQYFNYDPTHVHLLTNKTSLVNDWVSDKGFNIFGGKNATNPIYGEPTKGNFLETLDWLKTNSTSEDKVVLLFFMHGGPYSDILDNDIEADGDDEALIFKNSQLLVDGELAELLKGVKAKEMIIYTGSCYGGGFIWDLEKELGSLTNLRVIGGAHEDRIQWVNTTEDWLFKYPYLDQWQDTAGRILWYVSGMYKDYENGTLNITPGLSIPIERAWLDFPNCTIPDLENLKSHMVYVTPGPNGEFNYSSMCGGTPPPENVTAYLNNNRDLFFFGLDEKQSIVDKSIKVLSPNGGEKLKKGSSYNITWNSTGLIKEVGISILKNHQNICSGGSCYGTIYTSNDGSYQWNVPGAFEIGDNYTIKIWDMSERPIHDESDYYFSIVNKQ